MGVPPNVAGLELCRELHAVSGWEGTTFSWYCDEERDDDPALNVSEPLAVVGGVGYFDHQYPAYDLGYLIRHLPLEVNIFRGGQFSEAVWHRAIGFDSLRAQGETPENAAARLAIALFKQALSLLEGGQSLPQGANRDLQLREAHDLLRQLDYKFQDTNGK